MSHHGQIHGALQLNGIQPHSGGPSALLMTKFVSEFY
jgi:hypothetical protein